MKIKFGAIITDGRGKIGGHVASKNRAGAYLRTKVTPVNAQNPAQTEVRNRFATLSQAWRALTQALILAWNAAVPDFAKTDIFGDLKQPTGFNLYQRLNNNLITVGEDAIDTPPLPGSVGEVTASSLAIAEGAATMSLVMGAAVPLVTAVKVFATAPVSAGKTFVKSEYRLIDVLAAEATSPVNLKTAYLAKYGSLGMAGQKIFVKLVAVNTTTGQEGSPSAVSGVVAA
jgi:hypothetical protein